MVTPSLPILNILLILSIFLFRLNEQRMRAGNETCLPIVQMQRVVHASILRESTQSADYLSDLLEHFNQGCSRASSERGKMGNFAARRFCPALLRDAATMFFKML